MKSFHTRDIFCSRVSTPDQAQRTLIITIFILSRTAHLFSFNEAPLINVHLNYKCWIYPLKILDILIVF